MKISAKSVSALTALCALSVWAQTQETVATSTLPGTPIYITHVNVIDTENGRELKDRTVVISADRISEVRDSKGLKPPSAAKVIDSSGKFLIPGLWDMHVHSLREERIQSTFPMLIANGVLGIRDMGTDMKLSDVQRLRDEVRNGSRLGPMFVATGQILDGRPKPPSATFAMIRTAEQGREAVQILKNGGADFVKVYTWLPRDSYFAIVEEAKKQGLTFAGHVPMSVSAVEASDAGQKSIEHLNGIDLVCSSRENDIRNSLEQSGEMSDAAGHNVIFEASASYDEEKAQKVFAKLAQNHTWQVPTFVAFLQDAEFNDSRVTGDPRLKYIPPSIRKQWDYYAKQHSGPTPWDKVMERHLAIVGAMHRAGVPILAGTDSAWGVPFIYTGFSLHDELTLLARAGLTPAEVLQTATINPAQFLGMEHNLGSIEKGKIADLVLLDADPLKDIRNTTRISGVFLSGRYLDRGALNKLLNEAEAAANSASSNVKAYVH